MERLAAVVNPQNIYSQRVPEKLILRHTKNAQHYDADLMYYEISSEGYESDGAPYLLRRI